MSAISLTTEELEQAESRLLADIIEGRTQDRSVLAMIREDLLQRRAGTIDILEDYLKMRWGLAPLSDDIKDAIEQALSVLRSGGSITWARSLLHNATGYNRIDDYEDPGYRPNYTSRQTPAKMRDIAEA